MASVTRSTSPFPCPISRSKSPKPGLLVAHPPSSPPSAPVLRENTRPSQIQAPGPPLATIMEQRSYPTRTSHAPAQMSCSSAAGQATSPLDLTDNGRTSSGLRDLVHDVLDAFRHVPLRSKPESRPWHENNGHGPGDHTSIPVRLEGLHGRHIAHIPPGPCNSDSDSSSSASMQQPKVPASPTANVMASWPLDNGSPFFESAGALSGRSRDDISTRYTLDGVPLYRENAPSLRDYDYAREASFSASLSTTYSESILGIDLDLLHHQHLALDSASLLATPTPLEEHSFSCSPGNHEGSPLPTVGTRTFMGEGVPTTPSRSLTSSVFPVLLPLAAASGVVQHNRSPAVTFYSPSGNIIQPQEADWSCELSSRLPENISFRPVFRSPSGAQQAPSKATLPTYLRRTPNSTYEYHGVPITMNTSTVKGCHGVYRKGSLTQRDQEKRPIWRSVSQPLPPCRGRREKPRPSLFTEPHSSPSSNSTTYLPSREVTFRTWLRWVLGICCPLHYGAVEGVGGCLDSDKFNTTHAK